MITWKIFGSFAVINPAEGYLSSGVTMSVPLDLVVTLVEILPTFAEGPGTRDFANARNYSGLILARVLKVHIKVTIIVVAVHPLDAYSNTCVVVLPNAKDPKIQTYRPQREAQCFLFTSGRWHS